MLQAKSKAKAENLGALLANSINNYNNNKESRAPADEDVVCETLHIFML